MVVSSFAIGILGPSLFETGFADGFLCILFFNIIGITPVSFFSALGPKFGLRQVRNTRYDGLYVQLLISI
jgi:purine-cytosine permease-like protein